MRVGRIRGIERNEGWLDEQYVGVEIELEECTQHLNPAMLGILGDIGWSCVSDGSLRGQAYEAISAPTPISRMLDNTCYWFDTIKSRLGGKGSVRTGIHVHFDMLDRTLQQVAAVCTMYSLVEPALFRTLPPDREQCIYCVPWYRAPSEAELLSDLTQLENRRHIIDRLMEHGVKYSALNLMSLTEHGTIEFRMAPTFDTGEELKDWIYMLNNIVQLGLWYGTPDAVMEAALTVGLDRMIGLPDVVELAEEYDAYYCAETLGSGQDITWVVPQLDLDDSITHVSPYEEEEYDTMVMDFDDDGADPIRALSTSDLLNMVARPSMFSTGPSLATPTPATPARHEWTVFEDSDIYNRIAQRTQAFTYPAVEPEQTTDDNY